MSHRTVQRVHFLYPLLSIVFLVGGMILATLVLQYWMILLALATTWSVMVMFITRLICNRIYSAVKSRQKASPVVHIHRLPIRFPETPMPVTPLIRVLETVDLSSANMENFMDTLDDTQTMPESSAQEQNEYTNSSGTHQIP